MFHHLMSSLTTWCISSLDDFHHLESIIFLHFSHLLFLSSFLFFSSSLLFFFSSCLLFLSSLLVSLLLFISSLLFFFASLFLFFLTKKLGTKKRRKEEEKKDRIENKGWNPHTFLEIFYSIFWIWKFYVHLVFFDDASPIFQTNWNFFFEKIPQNSQKIPKLFFWKNPKKYTWHWLLIPTIQVAKINKNRKHFDRFLSMKLN